MSFTSWLRSHASRRSERTQSRSRELRHSRKRATLLRLEVLEDRALLAQFQVSSLLDDGSAGTLRDAITQANSTAGADEIVFAASGTITLTGGPLTIRDSLTIIGPGASQLAISGNHTSRVFEIYNSVIVSISGLTIRDGVAGVLNPSFDLDWDGSGGGVLVRGSTFLTLTNCFITGNSAGRNGGGVWQSSGTLRVNNCVFSGNSAVGSGGGIGNAGGTTVVTNSVLDGNIAGGSGGGIAARYLGIVGSTVSGNWADQGGGLSSDGVLMIANSTIAGNSAAGAGGGISLTLVNSGSSSLLNNVTIVGNHCNASLSGGTGGGIWVESTARPIRVNNTIVAGNLNDAGSETPDDVAGALASASAFNLIGIGGSGGLLDRTADPLHGNQVGVADPGLGQLGSYGGPTQTIPLLPGSPAVGSGGKGLAFGETVSAFSVEPSLVGAMTTDQRGAGFARFYNGTVDIGAYQSQLALPRTTLTVTTTADSGPGSLRQAIHDNNWSGGGNTIAFALPAGSAITLTGGELSVVQEVTISGPGGSTSSNPQPNF